MELSPRLHARTQTPHMRNLEWVHKWRMPKWWHSVIFSLKKWYSGDSKDSYAMENNNTPVCLHCMHRDNFIFLFNGLYL